ncbi:MAG: A24 family peptidase [Chloroflexota bacterium]
MMGLGTAVLLGAMVGWGLHWLSDRWPKQSPAPTTRWISGLLMSTGAALFGILWQRLGFSSNFAFLATLITFFLLIAAIDLKHQLIPNSLILPAVAAMLLYQFIPLTQGSWWALAGCAAAFLLFAVVRAMTPGGLGGGDVKLAAFLGATFGLPYLFWALLAGGLVGGGTAVFLLIGPGKNRKQQMPYGPFLCLGGIVALLYNPLPLLTSLF